jgi:hypothetical protein
MFDSPRVETLEHWWNSLWGTSSRRDVWLRYDPSSRKWTIEARQGGRTARGEYDTEEHARAILGELVSRGPGTWVRLRSSESEGHSDGHGEGHGGGSS